MIVAEKPLNAAADHQYDFISGAAFIAIHLLSLAVFWTGVSWVAAAVCVLLYGIRMFGITAAYHRYFSHHTYKTSRAMQFVLALLGTSAAQKGPLWWAAHHRHHHRHSDQDEDIHSPGLHGIWWAHVGWIMSPKWADTNLALIPDFAKYPELRFLNRNYLLVPILLGLGCFALGAWLEVAGIPGIETTAWQMLVVGFFLSTVLLYHGTFCINSFCHLIGRKRYPTGDESRNSLLMALITLGEGWHNNHHFDPGSERQGIYWYEIDISHYCLKGLAVLGLIWDIRGPTREAQARHSAAVSAEQSVQS